MILVALVILRIAESEGAPNQEVKANGEEESVKADRVKQPKVYNLEDARQEIQLLKDENQDARQEIQLLKDENQDAKKKIQLLKDENKDAMQEIKLLLKSNIRDKRRMNTDDTIFEIERRNRNADEADEEKIVKGKIDSISGRQDGVSANLRQMQRPTTFDHFVNWTIGNIEKLNKTVEANGDEFRNAFLERRNQEKLLKKADDSIKTKMSALRKSVESEDNALKSEVNALKSEVNTLKSEDNALKSAIAKQLRCLSGHLVLKNRVHHNNFLGRVLFNPAFSETPDICFGTFSESGETFNTQLIYQIVNSTHFSFAFVQLTDTDKRPHETTHLLSVQWMACGHSNGGRTAEILLDLKFNK